MTVSKPSHVDRLNQKSRRASGKYIESPPCNSIRTLLLSTRSTPT
jgi:hypothetical protein